MSEELAITKILRKYKLLDDEDYLVPPDSKHASKLVHHLASLRDIAESAVDLSPEEKIEMHEIQMAFDYYNDALDEELGQMTGEYVERDEECEEDEEEEEDEFYEDEEEEEEDEGDAESLEDKGIAVADLGHIVEDIEEEEDDSFEP